MEDIFSAYNDPSLEEKRKAAEQAAGTAGQYQTAAATLPNKLRQALMEKVDYNRDIINEQNKKMADYFAAPSVAREKYQNVWNPFEREKLVAQERSNAYAPYATLTDVLGERRGTINDLLQGGVGAFGAQVSAQQNNAQQARRAYEDAYGVAKERTGTAKWIYEQTHKGTGGGLMDNPLMQAILMKALFGGGNEPTSNDPTQFEEDIPEEQPTKNIPINFSSYLPGGINTAGGMGAGATYPTPQPAKPKKKENTFKTWDQLFSS